MPDKVGLGVRIGRLACHDTLKGQKWNSWTVAIGDGGWNLTPGIKLLEKVERATTCSSDGWQEAAEPCW